jgi:KDO2-lipid IV(A) lauroyltransferase
MKTRLEYGAFKVFMFFFAVLPRSWCLKLGRGLGTLTYRCDRHHRNIALANLRQAFGQEKGPAELRAIARDSFRRFGETVADIFKLFPWKPADIAALIDIEGRENLENAVALGKGVLLFGPHRQLGNRLAVISRPGRSASSPAPGQPLLDRAL